MNRLLTILLSVITASAVAQSTKDRIIPNNPDNYRKLSSVHAGAGQMGFTQLIGRTELSTNFLYLHSGIIDAKSGIGHHFHHSIEEMYVILNGEAEFTINGRTSTIKAPAVVPCKLGDAHAIYNASDEPIRWLNFAVSVIKGKGDAFDLGDDRSDVVIDPIPVFVAGRFEESKLSTKNTPYPGEHVNYRRILGPEVFTTDWNHVDHVVIPAGTIAGPRQLEGIEEVYYVIKGTGAITTSGEKASIKADDSFFALLGEELTIANEGEEDLELLVIGISASKLKDPNKQTYPITPKAMVLQMDFIVKKENADAFEKMYHSIYVPAMTVQQGYLESKLLRIFPENLSKEIEAESTTYNYQIQISFDKEENRRRWQASDQHQIAWPSATSLAEEYKWRGYDLMGDDDQH